MDLRTTILTSRDGVVGQIYLIENTTNGKQYVGQTVSHRKNKDKYRPFGYEGRFKDHMSEAMCNTKKKQCTYLNNAIRLHRRESFKVSLLHTCSIDELDQQEQHFIVQHGSLYPNGYNLSRGGKTFKATETPDITPTTPTSPAGKRGGCTERTPETREKMSKSLKATFGTQEVREMLMSRAQQQHLQNKLELFKGVLFDSDNVEQYIHAGHTKVSGHYIRVRIGDKRADFIGKHESLDQLKNRAIKFLKQVKQSATLPN
jgi:hypothetical protein